MRRFPFWAWFWFLLGLLYFFLPLFSTLEFSLRMLKGRYTLEAYKQAFADPRFYTSFGYSVLWASITIVVSLLLVVPTAYWVHLRLPRLLMPFVVPAVVLVFGLVRLYGGPPLVLTTTPVVLVAGYVVLSLPYMYRSVDSGLRAVDIRTLTEAAQSLGANWFTVLKDVIFPNLRVALLSGIFLTFAIVMGEFTFAALLAWPAFGPYIEEIGSMRAYTPQAVSVMSFGITWISIAVMQWVARGVPGQATAPGAR
jgi:putative spermidine/putrescine transport system permease protein